LSRGLRLYPPFIFARHYARSNWDLVIALCFCLLAGAFFYGPAPAFFLVLFSLLGAVSAEIFFSLLFSLSFDLTDGWAISVGLIVALILPPSIPFYIPLLVSALAVFLGKAIPGGIGRSLVSPVALAMILSMLIFPNFFAYAWPGIEGTALGTYRVRNFAEQIFSSSGSGAFGATSLFAMILALLYLLLRRTLNWRIALFYFLGSCFLFAFPQVSIFSQVLAGDVFLLALFIVPQENPIPFLPLSKTIYGLIAGLFTVPLRLLFGPVIGALIALPLANVFVPLLNYLSLKKARNFLFQPVQFEPFLLPHLKRKVKSP